MRTLVISRAGLGLPRVPFFGGHLPFGGQTWQISKSSSTSCAEQNADNFST
jgi:hypothetical protein